MNAVVTVSLPALISNYRRLAARAAPAVAAAVVKADAYGLGMAHVAPALYAAGCRVFYVAWPEEGNALRTLLPHNDCTIAVFYGLSLSNTARFRALNLQPVISTLDQLTLCQSAGLTGRLQLETGMHRSGLPPEQWQEAASSGFKPALVFSHLAAADTPAHPLNRAQFDGLTHARALWPEVPLGLAASSGVYANPDYHLDEVRLGAALYGAIEAPDLEQVVRVDAPILEVRTLQPGDAVGYGAQYVADKHMRVATLGYGYADGYPRHISGKGFVVINKQRCAVLGRVSMDLITVDVTPLENLPETAQIYGSGYTILDAARDAGTIGYEILTRLGKRSKWVYEPITEIQ
jgi:alanine racemase